MRDMMTPKMGKSRDSQLYLHLSNRFESLAEALAAELAADAGDPLCPQTVVVSSAETARWLSMQLACHNGLAMGLRYPFPRGLIDELMTGLLGAEKRCSPRFSRDAMTWWLHDALPAHLARSEFAPIHAYLHGEHALRRFELARRIASLFDQYQIYRPELLLGWDKGDEPTDWQAELWRALRRDFPGEASFVDLHAEIAALNDEDIRRDHLPSRLRVFGLNTIPPAFLDILWKVSIAIPIDFYVLSPTDQYWSDLPTLKQRLRKGEETVPADGNPLALSLGRLGRELIEQLITRDFQQAGEYFDLPVGTTLLGHLQTDLLALRDGTRLSPKPIITTADRSIEIHSCHGRMREIEVLHDRLLHLFEQDPSLRARDILVMAPDIDAYAPCIQAVFGTPESVELRIPYSLADQSFRSRIAVADAFLRVLELGTSRFETHRVLAALECEPIRRRFGFGDLDLQRLRRWISDCGIIWALNAEHRKQLGFAAEATGTWAHGEATLLAGYAMNGRGPRMHAGVQPYEDLEGDHLETLERLLVAMDLFGQIAAAMAVRRDRAAWALTLGDFVHSLFGNDDTFAAELRHVQAMLAELGETDPLRRRESLPAEVIVTHLEHRLGEQAGGGGFLDGRVTFCSLKPMRAIPARVICLLGMNDGDFPRKGSRLAFDRMTQSPRQGDRSLREDDRHLFFEAILGARDHLVISYLGQSHRDTLDSPPAGVVTELLDYLHGAFELPAAVQRQLGVRHALQAFSGRYFVAGSMQSFSRVNAAAAKRLEGPSAAPRKFFSQPLPEPHPEWRCVSPQQLTQFFMQPIRRLCEWRLDLRLEQRDDEIGEYEPLELAGLSKYHLQQAMTVAALANQRVPLWQAAQSRGQAPSGVFGVALERENELVVESLVARVRLAIGNAEPRSLQLAATLGPWVLDGPIDGLHGHRLLRFRCAALKPKDQIGAWVSHLLVNLALPGTTTLLLDQYGEQIRFIAPSTPESTTQYIVHLLSLYWRGLQEPLPFLPACSLAFVEAERKGKSGFEAAERLWVSSPYQRAPAESEDPWHQLVFGDQSPLDDSFAVLARSICEPLLDHRELDE